MNPILKYTVWSFLVVLFCVGFRTFPKGNTWDISKATTAESKIFVSYPNGTTVVTNDLPSGDVLFGTPTVTVDQLMTSIFNDYNNIDAAFVVLANTSDTDYVTRATNREIEILMAGSSGATSGEAKAKVDGSGDVVGCSINLQEKITDDASGFVATVTHEIGHCLGLDHPQETVNARMSYYSSADNPRLLMDDKMGIVHFYPVNSEVGAEASTFGLSCVRKN